ncbi:SDR family NAD(P)-dependent oxidoreductase [Rhodococcus sp. HS-D2]|uniref:SDR family NAD(P)-dependent oxidoreductase n=1 Tax=Rhodococcus sp. HS-D2 TaxID=1384636 RepID=UPI0009ECD1D1
MPCTAARIDARFGTTVFRWPLDVTDRGSFDEFLSLAHMEFGGIDALVNNAGIMPTGAFLEETDTVTDRQIDVNVRGVILGSKPAAARFTEQGYGHIVNLGSVVGIEGAPGLTVYSATEHAMVGPDEVAAAIVQVIATARPGLRYVPRTAGAILGARKAVPEATRHRITAAFGLQSLALNTDETARAAYRRRTEAPNQAAAGEDSVATDPSGSAR